MAYVTLKPTCCSMMPEINMPETEPKPKASTKTLMASVDSCNSVLIIGINGAQQATAKPDKK